jgi:hypothetical protein
LLLLLAAALSGCDTGGGGGGGGPGSPPPGDPVTYTLTYNANGGSGGVPAASTHTGGASVTLANGGGLSYTGKDFKGWNKAANGSGAYHGAGSAFTITANTTLYAVWSGDGLSVGNPIAITTRTDLETMASNLSGYYQLVADLNLSGGDWTPIGDYATPFTGSFDGGGHTIASLTINRPGEDYVGLFGCVGIGGAIKNVRIGSGSSVSGNDTVGGVAGYKYGGGTITACSNAGAVTGAGNFVGGVAGGNNGGGTITACSNAGEVTATESMVGGVVGYNSGAITACYNTGLVRGISAAGGVAGVNGGGTITACYNTGEVRGSGAPSTNIGGVAGGSNGVITACYNTGPVTGASNVGGVAGENASGTITACYASASISTGGGIPGTIFGSGDWPSEGMNTGTVNLPPTTGSGTVAVTNLWHTGDGTITAGTGKLWKSLGGWNGGSPAYPKLWWE